MNITKMKWLAAIVPAICIGIFEFVRHEFLHVVSMNWGNLMVAIFSGILFLLYSHGIFALMENLHKKLQQEREERAVLQERWRIARELHDNVAQSLFFLNVKAMEIETALKQRENPVTAVRELREAIKFTDADIRNHILSLQQVAPVTAISFTTAVRSQLEQFGKQSGLLVTAAIDDAASNRLSAYEANQLLHIFRELLLNIRKHAQATAVTVRVTQNSGVLQMEVRDNGVGFSLENQAQFTNSFGFKMLREDAESIGAALSIRSAPGNGTTATLTLQEVS